LQTDGLRLRGVLRNEEIARNLALKAYSVPNPGFVEVSKGRAATPKQLPSFLTFEIEEWYRVNYETCPTGWMERLTERFLEICNEAGCRSTFFVLGTVAGDYPQLVKAHRRCRTRSGIARLRHKAVFSMTPAAFKEDLRRSCGILESLTGKAVQGFRAPSFSVTRQVLPWYYDTLEKAGLAYSSSVFSGKTFLYGISDFPYRVHRPVIEGRQTGITEFPITRVDVAGKTLGLYARLFPASFLRRRIRRENAAGRPAMLYVHPREIDPGQPRLALPWPQSFIHYFGVRGCERKLRRLLRTAPGPFLPIAEALGRYPEFSQPEAT